MRGGKSGGHVNGSKREESLTPGHGLTTVDWTKTLHVGISDILGLRVQSSKGTFSEFVAAVGNGQSYTWRTKDNGTGGFKNDFGMPNFLTDGSHLSLGDLLSRERTLASDYEIANNGWGNVDLGFVLALDDSIKILFIPNAGTDMNAAIRSYGFPASAKMSIELLPASGPVQMQMICIEVAASGEDRKRAVPLAFNQDKNMGWLIRPLPNRDNIIDVHRMYIEAFILGMLSRYFPSKWLSLLRSDKGDIARSVILAAVARIEATFPQLLCDQLH